MVKIKKIKDPIHNYIFLSELETALTDTAEMQRLRRIKQIATAYLVFPGANHTRFEHSLGVCHLARQCCRYLDIKDEAADRVCAAALLHDVGHGPFSHLCEDAHVSSRQNDPSHEDITKKLIEDRKGSIAPILKDHGMRPGDITNILSKKGRQQKYGELIAGDIDVDRMDYLVRDAHYTGVSVGFDIGRLATSFTFHNQKLTIKESALTSAEALLYARFLMYSSVYFHRAVRASEQMLVRAIECAVADNAFDSDELRHMDDIALVSALRRHDGYARDLFENIENRRLHKCAFERKYNELREPLLATLLKTPKEIGRMEREIADRCDLEAHDVIIDVPAPPILPESKAKILLSNGSAAKIEKVSKLVAILAEAQKDHWMLRVFAPKAHRDRVKSAAEDILNVTWW